MHIVGHHDSSRILVSTTPGRDMLKELREDVSWGGHSEYRSQSSPIRAIVRGLAVSNRKGLTIGEEVSGSR